LRAGRDVWLDWPVVDEPIGGIMRKLLIAMLGLGLTSLLIAPVAGAARNERTRVTHNCTHTKVKPERIIFACGDGGFYATRLHWGHWGNFHARGHGIFHLNDCKPNCAEGTFHVRRGHIKLRRARFCHNVDHFVFRRAKIVYKHPFHGGDRVERERLFCPF
jgi:hypothetical protein